MLWHVSAEVVHELNWIELICLLKFFHDLFYFLIWNCCVVSEAGYLFLLTDYPKWKFSVSDQELFAGSFPLSQFLIRNRKWSQTKI
jgi:hypothetical protein